MNTIGLCLEPLDVLFFRDGRPFAAASRVTSGLPTPQVLAGAVRTALLEKYRCDFKALAESTRSGKLLAEGLPQTIRWIADVKFRGPWLCRLADASNTQNNKLDVYLPVPATLHTAKKGLKKEGVPPVQQLTPLKSEELPGWKQSLTLPDREVSLRPLWIGGTDPTEPATGFIDSSGLKTFLEGEDPGENNLHKADEFYCFDNRTGIGINAESLTTGDGEIYGVRFLSLKCGYGFYADIQLPPDAPADALSGVTFLAFGGEGKRAATRVLEKPFDFPAPSACDTSRNQKRLLLLTTPSVTKADGQPYFPEKCVAAAVNSPVAISGWDIAKNGPKPTRFAAPAGSIYFLDTADPIPEQTDEFGYGCHLQGVWTDG
jgi:CRISPR-associated protein Cmr3